MTNPQRGETRVEVAGRVYPLSLTLAALAEIETALGVDGFEALSKRLKRLNAPDLAALLTALLRAGGADAAEEIAGRADPRQAAEAVAACLKANLA